MSAQTASAGAWPVRRCGAPDRLGWLLAQFADRVLGVEHAIVVSVDGLQLATSPRISHARADQVSAITSGLVSLSQGVAKFLGAGALTQTLVEMQGAMWLILAVGDGSCLTVLAEPDADLGLIGYEMALLAERVGQT